MRFGILGPANDDLSSLERGASLLLFEHGAEEVIYLGPDDALDRLVLQWARRLVEGDPSDEAIWDRAALQCSAGDSAAIDRFLAAEQRRERLKALRCLPAATSRTVEMIEGKVAVLLYDKALLDEEDILPASLLIFGKHPVPLVRQVGSRTFISPGELTPNGGGIALLVDDAGEGLRVDFYGADGTLRESHPIALGRTVRLRIQDGAPEHTSERS